MRQPRSGAGPASSRKLFIKRLEFFEDFGKLPTKRKPLFRCKINFAPTIRALNFFAVYDEGYWLVGVFRTM